MPRFLASVGYLVALAVLAMMPTAAADGPKVQAEFRGVYFNPIVKDGQAADYPWPNFESYTKAYRSGIRKALRELARDAKINLVDVFIPIPFTLARPAVGNRAGQPLREWANVGYLDNVARFVDDCHEAGIAVELDLADNRWVPYSVDSANHLGRPGNQSWPVADDTPWDESATWYSEIITYIESRTKHPESIAMWSMMGNYTLGTAEPCLWAIDANPAILSNTEVFVKRVWPAFRAAGKRPKAAPYAFPIFSNASYWMAKSPEQRLSGFSNLKKWLVDDLALPPDYWPMSTYPFCDPAPDGFHYLRRIVEILGKENAARILSTDLKGPGHEKELADSIISVGGHTGPEMLEWHFQKCAEYGFAGWWIYGYQDRMPPAQQMGIRDADGRWKGALVDVIKRQGEGK